jgi:hypothetical protein
LCRERGKFVYEIFPDFFGINLSLDEFFAWKSFDIYEACRKFDLDPRDYDNVQEVLDVIQHEAAREKRRLARLAGGR